MNDLVSIICPSYNCAGLISQTINSVLSQTYRNWELLILDDASTDGTDKVVAPYLELDERIRFYPHAVRSGAALERNQGIQLARGRWIAFLDSDDLWTPDKLEKQIRFMEENGYSFSYTMYTEMDSDGKDTGVLVTGPKRITRSGMYAYCWPGCLTIMYDANAVGLIQIEDIQKNNDYAIWLKISKKADCYLLQEVLAKYRRGRAGSVSTHGLFTLIKWHYYLFRRAEKKSVISSLWHTGVNLVCGAFKKIWYVKRNGD